MINLPKPALTLIRSILRKHVPGCEVRVFGSRAGAGKTKTKPYSDLDLAIVGKKKLPKRTLYALKEDFEESDVPFRVDVLDWHAISPEFKKVIEKKYQILQ